MVMKLYNTRIVVDQLNMFPFESEEEAKKTLLDNRNIESFDNNFRDIEIRSFKRDDLEYWLIQMVNRVNNWSYIDRYGIFQSGHQLTLK